MLSCHILLHMIYYYILQYVLYIVPPPRGGGGSDRRFTVLLGNIYCSGLQFCHIRYIRPGGVTPVNHERAQLSRLEAVVDASPKSPESPESPMASQPQTPAQPTQPTVVTSVKQKRWVPQFALEYPCNPPPPPPGGDRHAPRGEATSNIFICLLYILIIYVLLYVIYYVIRRSTPSSAPQERWAMKNG